LPEIFIYHGEIKCVWGMRRMFVCGMVNKYLKKYLFTLCESFLVVYCCLIKGVGILSIWKRINKY
jgi:hypothetical protein